MSITFPLDLAAPYPGLRPFLRDESIIFFGRDAQIDDVLARLKQHQFLGVVGTSGCGKSSLIRAGMLPALESGLMGELGSSWFIADMKPGDAPLTNLAQALMQSGVLGDRWSNTPEGIALLSAALRRSDVSLVNLIQQVELPKYTNLLVLADQFEEIFRFQQSDPNEALAFVNLLLATGHDRSVPIYVVLTMRSDYLGQCALFPGLPEALNDAQYLCPRLTRDQLAEAIEGPASVFGGEVERALVTQIVNDAGANSDQLPLVQHVLARIWRIQHGCPHSGPAPKPESEGTVLNLKGYHLRGSLNNALSQHADEAYFELADDSVPKSRIDGPDHKPSRKQLIAQMLFCCLAELGSSGQYVRRPVKVQDVAAVAGCSVAEVIEVVDVFRREDRSFLTPAKPKPGESDRILETPLDISHEALIRQWQRFGGPCELSLQQESSQSWLAQEDLCRRRYRRLAESADSEPTAGLLRDPELSFLDKWWQEFQPREAWGNGCVKDSFQRTRLFLARSRDAARDEARQKQAEQQKRLELAENLVQEQTRRAEEQSAKARVFYRMLWGIGLIAVVAVMQTLWALQAKQAANIAEGREKQSKEDLNLALTINTEMFRLPTVLVGKIAAAVSNRQNIAALSAFNELNSQTKPIVLTPAIENAAISLRMAISEWRPDEMVSSDSEKEHSSEAVRQAVLRYVIAMRNAWESQFPSNGSREFSRTKKLSQSVLLKPTYDRAIQVTRAIADGSRDQQEIDAFESLYWSELVFLETDEVSTCMVRFRRSLRGDPDYRKFDLKTIAVDFKNACDNALVPTDRSVRGQQ